VDPSKNQYFCEIIVLFYENIVKYMDSRKKLLALKSLVCYNLSFRYGEVSLAEYDYEINQRVVKIRKKMGCTQKKFAEPLKISNSFQGEIETNHRKVNERLMKMICLTYGVSETWLKTGQGEMFDIGKDPRLERIIRNFNKLDQPLQDYVMDYLEWLVVYYSKH